ncbi:MAG: endonuclease domain-containing protein [Saccharofermentanales bacterium]
METDLGMSDYVEKYIYGKSALDYWGVPAIRGKIEPPDIIFPEEYVIFTDKPLYRPDSATIHTCSIPGADQYVDGKACTLPLVFLQVALSYSVHELIYLGLQCCSYREGDRPRCTVEELRACAEKLRGHRGRRKALRAIRYLENNSRSPMESILYMFLRLPNALGGCGFNEIVLNERIDLDNGNKTYFADLYVPSCKLDIEYDSEEFHSSRSALSKDRERAAHLEAEGYRVVSVGYSQLTDLKAFRNLTRQLSRLIGKRIYIRARKFFENFVALRDLLLKKGNNIRSRFRRIHRNEVPWHAGVRTAYKIYLAAWNRLIRHPNQPLVLTRAP